MWTFFLVNSGSQCFEKSSKPFFLTGPDSFLLDIYTYDLDKIKNLTGHLSSNAYCFTGPNQFLLDFAKCPVTLGMS